MKEPAGVEDLENNIKEARERGLNLATLWPTYALYETALEALRQVQTDPAAVILMAREAALTMFDEALLTMEPSLSAYPLVEQVAADMRDTTKEMVALPATLMALTLTVAIQARMQAAAALKAVGLDGEDLAYFTSLEPPE